MVSDFWLHVYIYMGYTQYRIINCTGYTKHSFFVLWTALCLAHLTSYIIQDYPLTTEFIFPFIFCLKTLNVPFYLQHFSLLLSLYCSFSPPVCECHFSTSSLLPDVIAYLTSILHSWTLIGLDRCNRKGWDTKWLTTLWHSGSQFCEKKKDRKKWLENVNNKLHFGVMLTHCCRAQTQHE